MSDNKVWAQWIISNVIWAYKCICYSEIFKPYLDPFFILFIDYILIYLNVRTWDLKGLNDAQIMVSNDFWPRCPSKDTSTSYGGGCGVAFFHFHGFFSFLWGSKLSDPPRSLSQIMDLTTGRERACGRGPLLVYHFFPKRDTTYTIMAREKHHGLWWCNALDLKLGPKSFLIWIQAQHDCF